MKNLLLLLSLVYCKWTTAQTYVLIPDANFAACLQTIVPTAMSGNSLDITSTLVTTSTQTINVRGNNITNLTGVQYFSSLTNLNCSQNSISNLPALANSITWLWCSDNSLTSLPSLPSLQILFADTNQLSTLPALPTGLVSFYVSHNLLNSLPALPNSIKYVGVDYNNLTSLPTLPTSLLYLYCYNNNLTTLPSLPGTLTKLYCYYNNLTSLPPLPSSLQRLYCDHNNITCFPHFPSTISSSYFNIHNNPFNCLPNYIAAMGNDTITYPLCFPGNSNGCHAVGIKELDTYNNPVNVFPNPASGEFVIESSKTEKQTVKLFDMTGKILFVEELNSKINIDVTNLSSGVYNLIIKTGDNIVNKKLVIAR